VLIRNYELEGFVEFFASNLKPNVVLEICHILLLRWNSQTILCKLDENGALDGVHRVHKIL
jgi:hypothetical protein